MAEQAASHRGIRLRPLHWSLIAVAVLVAVGLTVFVVTRDDSGAPQGTGSGSPRPDGGASAEPMCLPRVVETGYTYQGTSLHYGLIVENPCPRAAIDNVTTLSVIDNAGNQVNGSGDGDPPSVPVLLPGQRIGAGGTVFIRQRTQIAQVVVRFTHSEAAPAGVFAGWPRKVTVERLTRSGPDARAVTFISGRIRSDPPTARLCAPQVNLILRNHSGRITYGQNGFPEGTTASFDVELPADTDFAQTEVYVVLGRPAVGLRPAEFAACRTDS